MKARTERTDPGGHSEQRGIFRRFKNGDLGYQYCGLGTLGRGGIRSPAEGSLEIRGPTARMSSHVVIPGSKCRINGMGSLSGPLQRPLSRHAEIFNISTGYCAAVRKLIKCSAGPIVKRTTRTVGSVSVKTSEMQMVDFQSI